MMSGVCTSAGAQESQLMPNSASCARRSFSAAFASARGNKPSVLSLVFSLGGRRETKGESAAASAPSATASRTRPAAPAGASFMTWTKAKGTSAYVAKAGSEMQSCSAQRHKRNLMSAARRSWAKLKSCGQEKPRRHRALPPTMWGSSTERRQRPVSAMDSTARESMGAECLPGSFGKRPKNCMSLEAVAMASAWSSSSSSSAVFSPSMGTGSSAGLCTQEVPRCLVAFVAAAAWLAFAGVATALGALCSSSTSTSSRSWEVCLKASTSIQPRAHCSSRTGSRRCSSKKTWPKPRSHRQSGSTATCLA
mmetsp:Transcript_18467/g.51351  ORF Transcript_18467/g.51351 Transcript_18467/m.51351 type:complete len:308 (+) Transcript_18467:286-1209(+)